MIYELYQPVELKSGEFLFYDHHDWFLVYIIDVVESM